MASTSWDVLGFVEALDAWVEREQPADELRRFVTQWIFTRMDDPYALARRADGFADYWWAVVPGSEDPDGRVVLCFFWIDPAARTARCDTFSSLSPPFTD